jgi:hypothetical protein
MSKQIGPQSGRAAGSRPPPVLYIEGATPQQSRVACSGECRRMPLLDAEHCSVNAREVIQARLVHRHQPLEYEHEYIILLVCDWSTTHNPRPPVTWRQAATSQTCRKPTATSQTHTHRTPTPLRGRGRALSASLGRQRVRACRLLRAGPIRPRQHGGTWPGRTPRFPPVKGNLTTSLAHRRQSAQGLSRMRRLAGRRGDACALVHHGLRPHPASVTAPPLQQVQRSSEAGLCLSVLYPCLVSV